MSELQYDEWMSETDAVLWHIEHDPQLRSTITSVWFLDSVPDRDRMDAAVERIIAKLPRLGQRVIDAQPGVSTPRWEEDPHFDPTYHYRWVRLPGPKPGVRAVYDYAQHMATQSFDKDRPLWELSVIEKLRNKRAALVMKIHHAITDGLGMVQMLQHMVDLEADPASSRDSTQPHATTRPSSAIWDTPAARPITHRISSEAKTGVRLGRASLRTASQMMRDPIGTIGQLSRTTGSVARVVAPASKPLSPLMTGRSTHAQFNSLTVPLDRLKAAANAVGGSLNDAFVASALGAVRRYHAALDSPCTEIRVNIPISVRDANTSSKADNQFVPARTVLPISETDAARRLTVTHALLRDLRDERALVHMNDITGVIGRLGPTASVSFIGAMMKGVDVTASNVPGPPFPVWVAGACVREMNVFGPLAGSAINIILFTYDGTVHLGINTDVTAVSDPDLFLRCMHEALDEILELATGDE